jgi:hypothetical protein
MKKTSYAFLILPLVGVVFGLVMTMTANTNGYSVYKIRLNIEIESAEPSE